MALTVCGGKIGRIQGLNSQPHIRLSWETGSEKEDLTARVADKITGVTAVTEYISNCYVLVRSCLYNILRTVCI